MIRRLISSLDGSWGSILGRKTKRSDLYFLRLFFFFFFKDGEIDLILNLLMN